MEYGIPRKLAGLFKMSLNENYSTILIGKNPSDSCPIQNGLKEGDALSPLLFNSPLGYTITKVQESQKVQKLNDTH
jgi:hypothetical protein